MLRHLLGFELGQLLKNGVFWIVVAVYALMGFGTMASDDVSIGGGVGNIMRNAPAVVISILGSFNVISVLLATIFVAGIAIRDFEQPTAELFFAPPMKKRDYLLGRFGGGVLATFALSLALALALYVHSLLPWSGRTPLSHPPSVDTVWGVRVRVGPER